MVQKKKKKKRKGFSVTFFEFFFFFAGCWFTKTYKKIRCEVELGKERVSHFSFLLSREKRSVDPLTIAKITRAKYYYFIAMILFHSCYNLSILITDRNIADRKVATNHTQKLF